MKSKSLIMWGPPYQYELTLFSIYIYDWIKGMSSMSGFTNQTPHKKTHNQNTSLKTKFY